MGQQTQTMDLVKGALVGGLVAGASALLLAPKSGKGMREDIEDAYHSVKDKAQELPEKMQKAGHQMLHPLEEDTHVSPFIIGGAVGAVLGAVSALLLAPQSGEELRHTLGDKYEEIRDKAEHFVKNLNSKGHDAMEQVGDWKETLNTLISKFSNHKGKTSSLPVADLVDWAGLGVKLLQQLQKRG